jgi:hypothetical protein
MSQVESLTSQEKQLHTKTQNLLKALAPLESSVPRGPITVSQYAQATETLCNPPLKIADDLLPAITLVDEREEDNAERL